MAHLTWLISIWTLVLAGLIASRIRSRFKVLRCAIASITLAVGLQACSNPTDKTTTPESTPVSISGFNYMGEGIQEFYVNGAWGGGISIGGGYGQVCCVVLPDKWAPGLLARIKWERSDCGGSGPGNTRCPFGTGGKAWHYKTLEKSVSIEPYDLPGSMQVMFLPNDEIKVFVSTLDPHHPNHPAKLGRPHPIGSSGMEVPL